MKLQPIYAIVDSHGNTDMEVDGSLEQTVEKALSTYPKHTSIVFNGDLDQLSHESDHRNTEQRRTNPPEGGGAAEEVEHAGGLANAAMKALGPKFWDKERGVPRTYTLADVYGAFPEGRAGAKAAFDVLRPLFPRRGEIKVTSLKNKALTEAGGEKLEEAIQKRMKKKKLSYEEARESLRGTDIVGGEYETPSGMSDAFLVSNAKTEKAVEGLESVPPSLSKGLAFLPHALGKDVAHFPRLGGLPMLKGNGVCVGSSPECRTSCLIYAGQNQAVEHNNVIKGIRLQAFLEHPEAFLRMVLDSTDKHIRSCRTHDLVPYFRPNILSDIPWEILFPEFWDVFPRLRVYDYSKLDGRDALGKLGVHDDGIARYDLTYSFSGVNGDELESELHRGMRLAIVFLRGLKSGSKSKGTLKLAESLSDLRFLGQRVIDGDFHDLRPLDPPGTVVGLRFKSLRGESAGDRDRQIDEAGGFVVDAGVGGYTKGGKTVVHRKGKGLVATPMYVIEAFRTDDGHTIVAGTPFQQGVSDQCLYGSAL